MDYRCLEYYGDNVHTTQTLQCVTSEWQPLHCSLQGALLWREQNNYFNFLIYTTFLDNSKIITGFRKTEKLQAATCKNAICNYFLCQQS